MLSKLALGCFEVLAHRRCEWMRLAQHADAVVEGLLKQLDGLGEASRRIVCACEVVARGQGVGVVFA